MEWSRRGTLLGQEKVPFWVKEWYPFGSRKSTLLGQGRVPRCQWPGSLALGIRGMTVVNNQMPMSMFGWERRGAQGPMDQAKWWLPCPPWAAPPPPPPRAAQCPGSMGQGSSFHTFHLCLWTGLLLLWDFCLLVCCGSLTSHKLFPDCLKVKLFNSLPLFCNLLRSAEGTVHPHGVLWDVYLATMRMGEWRYLEQFSSWGVLLG